MQPTIKTLIRRNGELLRFLVSGVIAFLTGIFILYLFTDRLGMWYLASSVIAFIGAFALSFALQKFWTFQDKNTHNVSSQLGMSALLALFNLLFNTTLMFFFVEQAHLHYLTAQVGATSVVAIETYAMFKYVIFPKKARSNSPT